LPSEILILWPYPFYSANCLRAHLSSLFVVLFHR
jgi:hypothetical protein